MVQIPLISGIYASPEGDYQRSLPVNLIPVAEPGDGSGTGVSKGYLRTITGVETIYTVEGQDRGSVVFKGQHLRVMGGTLYSISDTGITAVGGVYNDSRIVQFAEGFNRLGIASGGFLYYYDGATLSQVTDPDLGAALSVAWSDGYFITTDGSYIVVSELNDPASIDPLKYGSAEADPDPIIGMLALRGEVYALNRYSIEKFINAGTTGFPFQRSRGAQIPKGVVGIGAYTPFVETFAFCGSARNETASVYLAGAGQAIRISPRVLDDALARLTDAELAAVQLEALNADGLYQLYVHLPKQTWVYHWTASQLLDLPVWSILAGGSDLSQPWPARDFRQVGTEWWCGTNGKVGRFNPALSTLFGDAVGFRFDTPLVYNEGRGAIAHEAEIVSSGRPSVAMSYTNDGLTWSVETFAKGERLTWRRLGRVSRYRGFRFRGVLSGPASFARLDMKLEPLDA